MHRALLVAFLLLSATARAADGPVIREDGVVGCVDRESFDQFVQVLIYDGDEEAAKELLLDGRCESLPRGTRIFLVDTHPWSNRAEVRRKGSTRVLWTDLDAALRALPAAPPDGGSGARKRN